MLRLRAIRAALGSAAVLVTAGHLCRVVHAEAESVPLFDKATSDKSNGKRRAVVIGAGVSGVTTAYHLAKRGFEVVVLDSRSDVSAECSAAAAGGMQRMNPVVNAGTWKSAIKSLIPNNSDNTFRFFELKWSAVLTDPHFWRWLALFTKASLCDWGHERDLQQGHMLQFTDWAISSMLSLMKENGGALAKAAQLREYGAMKLHFTEETWQDAQNKTPLTFDMYPDLEATELLNRDDILKLEPWLARAHGTETLYGATYQTNAAMAHCGWFTHALANKCRTELGVKFVTNCAVNSMETAKDMSTGNEYVSAVETSCGRVELNPDTAVVVAAGSWTPLLLRKVGLFCPVYPLKGYNVVVQTPPNTPEQTIPQRIVVDAYVYITRYGNEVRIASIGEFAGWDTAPAPDIARRLRLKAADMLPHMADAIETADVVCGLRPYVPDGIIMIGAVGRYENVYTIVGPGFNGWKCALGAGEVLAAIVDCGEEDAKQKFDFDITALDPRRYIRNAPLFSWICNILSAA